MMIRSDDVVEHDLGDAIRKAFGDSRLSMSALSKQAGVPYAAVHGLLNGTSDARLSTATKLCRVLGLELHPMRRGKRKGE